MRHKLLKLAGSIVVLGAGVAGYQTLRPPFWETGAPLVGTSGPVALLDDLQTNALGNGWKERRFFRVTPTQYQTTEDGGARMLRCTTNNSASILARDTDIALSDLPILSWTWKVTEPIETALDESTEAGDDHPLRFFLRFVNETGETWGSEIIWSNTKYAAGDYKIIGSFYHLVANDRDAAVDVWHDQTVDLRTLFRDIGGTGTPRLDVLGFFCDSDNTGARSDGFFKDITLSAPSN
ncbi:DUF3047 domain-containing protein [Roseobacter sp.]|uniref:DUF3047 domain-containing protein n=1 Tax=Roseobacter sp. TaxID=1907202 RepID=UPI0032991E6D